MDERPAERDYDGFMQIVKTHVPWARQSTCDAWILDVHESDFKYEVIHGKRMSLRVWEYRCEFENADVLLERAIWLDVVALSQFVCSAFLYLQARVSLRLPSIRKILGICHSCNSRYIESASKRTATEVSCAKKLFRWKNSSYWQHINKGRYRVEAQYILRRKILPK